MSGTSPLALAVETSTALGSVALGRDGQLLAECTLGVRAVHSETLLPEAHRLLERAGHGPGDVERVVVGAGPGSFTGVRIAASLARGLCHGGGRELLAYSSLAAAAAAARPEGEGVCALFPAREDEVFAAALEGFSPLRYELDPAVLPLGELLDRLGGAGRTFVGEGATAHQEALRRAGGRVLPPFAGVPRAAALLWLAATDPASGRVRDASGWEPAYARGPGARPPVSPGGG